MRKVKYGYGPVTGAQPSKNNARITKKTLLTLCPVSELCNMSAVSGT